MSHTPYPKLIGLDTEWTLFWGWLNPDQYGKGRKAVNPVEDNLEPHGDWTVRDKSNHAHYIKLYHDVPKVINDILKHGAEIAIVSNSGNKAMVDRALYYFKATDKKGSKKSIIHLVKYDEVYCANSKVNHFKKIKNESGIDYSDMLLFDDEAVNNDVRHELGVTFQVSRDQKGLSWENYQGGANNYHFTPERAA
ncbi:hypothetical protein CONPUDRAFT_152711 [Coniophora puteana RWD-64-598 SS2]|uniref:Magnesium-dependent phosphatase-1 n=1 Tax=Coniophora puteana (strain RWD-64-598) TaxID=741705 RepID=A0A5M3MRU2_CONPW|nr:uncharacterized protein CONPUDRAFT_152711 [Coniophora puteana RWD-64-598 SS2]EIW81806.1 hypothetical protein CONPUDRAFT_152711 [Coniophora puteana RWD-64-598 SS2]